MQYAPACPLGRSHLGISLSVLHRAGELPVSNTISHFIGLTLITIGLLHYMLLADELLLGGLLNYVE